MTNTINNFPLYASLQTTDYLAGWQNSQSPSTRKITVSALGSYYLPLASGGTVGGNITVSSGGITVTGNSSINGVLSGLTGLTVASGGASITGNSTVTGNITATNGAFVQGGTGNGGNFLAFSTATCLTINQSGSTSAAAILVNLAQVGGIAAFADFLFAGNGIGSIAPNGGGTGVNYNVTSDQRLKIDDGLISGANAVDMVRGLKPRWFRWKSAPDADMEPGFFAQQVYRVFPWAVTKGVGKRRPWQMDQAKLMPIVVAALQSALERIEVLEKRCP